MVSSLIGSAAVYGLVVAGCVQVPGLHAARDPLVIAEPAPSAADGGDASAARAALVAEMQVGAQASSAQPLTQAELAARPEPRTAVEVAAITAELELIAERQAASADPREIAALEARARELRRLVAAAQAGPIRR